jgi:type I restriction enzyme S subunit
MVLLRPNPAKSDPRYLLYALQSKDVQHEIRVNEGTGSTVSNLRIPLLEALPVPSPPLEEQRAIAHILGTLDDKIELNRRMNETLEAMARALFKSWFVDFDPVRAKAANGPSLARGPHLDPIGEAERRAGQEVPMSDERHGGRDSRPTDPGLPKPLADLFPDSFEDSELGEIPKDWVMRPIYDIADVIYGAPFASSQFNTNGIGKPLIRIRDLVDEAPGVWTPEQHPKGYMVKPGDIAHVEATETATTVIHLGKGDIDRFSAVVPSPDVLAAFNRLCQPWYDRIVEVKHESRTLAALRDALLPKLISGEITASRLSNGNDNRRCG